MSIWQWTQFHLFLLSKSLHFLINKRNYCNFTEYKIFVFLLEKKVSRYLLNTHRKVSKKVSKVYSEVFGALEKPVFTGFSLSSTTIFVFFPARTWILVLRLLMALSGFWGRLGALFCPFWLPRALGKPSRRYLKRYLKFKNRLFLRKIGTVLFATLFNHKNFINYICFSIQTNFLIMILYLELSLLIHHLQQHNSLF